MSKPLNAPDWEQLDRNFHKWLVSATLEDRIKLYRFLMCKSVDLEKFIKGFEFGKLFVGVDFGSNDKAVMVSARREPDGRMVIVDHVVMENIGTG